MDFFLFLTKQAKAVNSNVDPRLFLHLMCQNDLFLLLLHNQLAVGTLHHTPHPKCHRSLHMRAALFDTLWFDSSEPGRFQRETRRQKRRLAAWSGEMWNLLHNGGGKIDSYCVTTCQEEECRYALEHELFSKQFYMGACASCQSNTRREDEFVKGCRSGKPIKYQKIIFFQTLKSWCASLQLHMFHLRDLVTNQWSTSESK